MLIDSTTCYLQLPIKHPWVLYNVVRLFMTHSNTINKIIFLLWFCNVLFIIWRVDIQKGVTHISEILHGGTETFPFRHLKIQIFDFQIENKTISDWKKKIVCAIVLALTSRICFAKKTIFEKLWVTPFWMSTLHLAIFPFLFNIARLFILLLRVCHGVHAALYSYPFF